MAWVALNYVDLTVDSIAVVDTINAIGGNLNDAQAAFVTQHTTAGAHNDNILIRGWGLVTFAGGTPTLTTKQGIVNTITDAGLGNVTMNLDTTAADTSSICAVAMASGTTSYVLTTNVASTTTVDVFIQTAGEVSTDADFFFMVSMIPV